ncbi:MAG: nucleoside deaminase [Acidobacteria bacterium]|nr:nucleoside deaminase [Acidobacteriota bacterium]
MNETDMNYLRLAMTVARRAKAKGNHPFGAVLTDQDGKLLWEAENTVETERDCTGHAETNLMRLASQHYDAEFLSACTLYSSTEPCAMCATAIIWGEVGRLVYALSAERFYTKVLPPHQPWSFRLSCREVFARLTRPVEIVGPMLEDEGEEVHQGFWSSAPLPE